MGLVIDMVMEVDGNLVYAYARSVLTCLHPYNYVAMQVEAL